LPLNREPETTSPGIAVRAARKSDIAALTELRSAFWSDQIAKGSVDNPDTDPARLSADTGKLIERARTILFLAMHGDKPVGYIFGQTKILPGSTVSSVEEIFTDPAYRHTKMARALADRALAAFQAGGAQRIQLRVLEVNGEGRTFWQQMGFAPSVTIYEYLNPDKSTDR
jgi:ribosomal protein S18 acetylase RimI-like enzyme